MHILLLSDEGRMEEALLLSSGPDRMRIMLRGQTDTLELRQIDGRWMYESGGIVDICAVMGLDRPAEVEQELARSPVQYAGAMTLKAGGSTRGN